MKLNTTTFSCLICACLFISAFAIVNASAQSVFSEISVKPAMLEVSKPPQISRIPDLDFPENARKNGVDGIVRINVTLAEDSQPKNITVEQGLPDGVTEAVVASAQKIKFQPAEKDGQPGAVKISIEYKFSLIFSEFDNNVKKPVITEKPMPAYPQSQKSSGFKDKVTVRILLRADGTSKVESVNSVMPKEFDQAASDAAQKIKFQPAVHKKTKKSVSQYMLVTYDFKP